MKSDRTKADVTAFFHADTGTVTYLVADAETGKAAVVDCVLDYDPARGRIETKTADRLIESIRQCGLSIDWILETHLHADHLSAAQYLKSQVGGRVCIGTGIRHVQAYWAGVFRIEDEFATETTYFDELFEDGAVRPIGRLALSAIHTPGHTPADMTFVVGDAAFVGDTLLSTDYGTARTDFPGGSASDLYRSIRRILDLPLQTRIFSAHDYLTPGRSCHGFESTVQAHRNANVHIHDGIDEASFVTMRTARDAQLALPNLIYPAVQVNIRAGRLPPAEANGAVYFKIPIEAFESAVTSNTSR